MKTAATVVICLVLIGMGAYQAWRPETMLRRNRDRALNWQPHWMRERALSRPNVWSARIAGILCCGAGIVILAVTLARW